MAVKDIIPIKYWIPRLTFNVKPRTNQYFKIRYGVYNKILDNIKWNKYSDKEEEFLPTGEPVNKMVLDNLTDNTKYIAEFTNTKTNDIFYMSFNTGTNIALGDSPYYDKVIIPGQVYEWFTPTIYNLQYPDTKILYYYSLDFSKAEFHKDESWGSMILCRCSGATVDFVKENETVPAEIFQEKKDKNNLAIRGFHIFKTKNDNNILLSTPNLKYNEDTKTYQSYAYYGKEDGGGGLGASDVFLTGFSFLFLTEQENNTICFCPKIINTKYIFKLYISDGVLMIDWWSSNIKYLDGNTGAVTSQKSSKFTTQGICSINNNEWILVHYDTDTKKLTIYNSSSKLGEVKLSEIEFKSGEIWPENSPGKAINSPFDNDYANNKVTPLIFGDENSDGVYISKFGRYKGVITNPTQVDENDDYIEYNAFKQYNYKLQLKVGDLEYTQTTKDTTLIKKDRIGFYINPDMIATDSGVFKDFDSSIKRDLILNILDDTTNELILSKTLSGHSYIDEDGSTKYLCGIVNPSKHLEDSYHINFKTSSNRVRTLGKYFFTKHGTWGGYNGGVNGFNIYFNSEGNLVLENHGDTYTGDTPGVSKESIKESDNKTYTGYGFDLKLNSNTWDRRSNKNCLRSGSAIVSNKYYTFGRIDITMKIPVGCWGVCPAIWLFHYIEIGDTDSRFDDKSDIFINFNKQGSAADGFYRVVNNEIDIELPSHRTNGTINKLSDVETCYFSDTIDNQLTIGVVGDTPENNGLYLLVDDKHPNVTSSWQKIEDVAEPRYHPSFQNCKLNNWIGELNSGDGWCKPQGNISARDYYNGTGEDLNDEKEEYQSQLTHIVNNPNGFADGKFHKWSIAWMKKAVVLLVDDQVIRINKGFVPFNIMKLTVAGWFPTMPLDNKNLPTGLKDRDGIHGTKNKILTEINDTSTTSIGTWAGTQAKWEVLHLEISDIEYHKFGENETVTFGDYTETDFSECGVLGESFPESGLRTFLNV